MCVCTHVAAYATECTRMLDQAPMKITGVPKTTLLNFMRVYDPFYAYFVRVYNHSRINTGAREDHWYSQEDALELWRSYQKRRQGLQVSACLCTNTHTLYMYIYTYVLYVYIWARVSA